MAEVCSSSEVGACRRFNEDRIFADGARVLVGVFDGGGENGAAAQHALDVTLEHPPLDASAAALEGLVERVQARLNAMPPTSRCITTLLVAMFDAGQSKVRIAHLGDSRAYRLRGTRFEQLTADHTLGAQLVANGDIAPEAAMSITNASALTRSLGRGSTDKADIVDVDVEPGDLVLLCTDGVWREIEDDEISAAVTSGPFAECAGRVTAAAATPGRDNSSAAAIRIS